MNFCRLSVLVGAVTAAAVSVAAFPSSAHALDFTWSFTGSSTNPGTVSGTVTGLSEGGNIGGFLVGVTATSPVGNPALILGNYAVSGNPFVSVTSGNISFVDWNGSKDGFSLSLRTANGLTNKLTDFSTFNVENTNPGASLTFTPVPVPFDIPGGITIPAVGGLLALGLMRKARKSLASNTRISEPISEVIS